MYRLFLLAVCILACSAASLPTGTGTKIDATCTVGGQTLKPGQRAVNGDFVMECQLTGNTIRTTIVACLDDAKNEHPVGDKWDTGKRPFRFVLQCTKADGVTSRSVAQCFYDSEDGQAKLSAGQEQKVGKNVVKCVSYGSGGLKFEVAWGETNTVSSGSSVNTNTNTGNTNTNANIKTTSTNTSSNSNTNSGIFNNNTNSNSNKDTSSTSQNSEPSPSSSTNRQEATCYLNGKELKVGQRGPSKSFVYECKRTGDKTIRNEIVACLDDNKPQGEHPIGDQWVESGDSQFPEYRYVFECAKNGEITEKRAVKCAYLSKDGRENKIEMGAKATVDNKVIECARMGENGVQYRTSYSPEYLASLNATVTTNTG